MSIVFRKILIIFNFLLLFSHTSIFFFIDRRPTRQNVTIFMLFLYCLTAKGPSPRVNYIVFPGKIWYNNQELKATKGEKQ